MVSFIKKTRITRNPYLLFLPFLFIYAACIFLLQYHELWGDEIRHFMQAENLLKGFYSPPAPNIDLGNGPGYPLLILPFVALHVPLVVIKLMNAVFLYFSIVFLFKVLTRYVSFRITLVCCFFWGCYYNSLNFIALIYAETFSVFLVSSLVLLLVNAFEQENPGKSRKYILFSGFVFGFLALTKVIFGYVILFMLAGCVLLWIKNRKLVNYKKAMLVMLVAAITVACRFSPGVTNPISPNNSPLCSVAAMTRLSA